MREDGTINVSPRFQLRANFSFRSLDRTWDDDTSVFYVYIVQSCAALGDFSHKGGNVDRLNTLKSVRLIETLSN